MTDSMTSLVLLLSLSYRLFIYWYRICSHLSFSLIRTRLLFRLFLLQFFKILISLLSLTWHLIHQGNTGRMHNQGKHIYHVSLDCDSLLKKTFPFWHSLCAIYLLAMFNFLSIYVKFGNSCQLAESRFIFRFVCFLLIDLIWKTNGHIFDRRKLNYRIIYVQISFPWKNHLIAFWNLSQNPIPVNRLDCYVFTNKIK